MPAGLDLRKCVAGAAVNPVAATQGVTSAALDFLQGDGICNLFVAAPSVTGLTALTVQVQESSTTASGWANITGAVATISTTGSTSVSFNRNQRYLRGVMTITGTTTLSVPLSATIFENTKLL